MGEENIGGNSAIGEGRQGNLGKRKEGKRRILTESFLEGKRESLRAKERETKEE